MMDFRKKNSIPNNRLLKKLGFLTLNVFSRAQENRLNKLLKLSSGNLLAEYDMRANC